MVKPTCVRRWPTTKQNYRKQLLKGLARRAKEMGFRLEPAEATSEYDRLGRSRPSDSLSLT